MSNDTIFMLSKEECIAYYTKRLPSAILTNCETENLFTCYQLDVTQGLVFKQSTLGFPSPKPVAIPKVKSSVCPTIYP